MRGSKFLVTAALGVMLTASVGYAQTTTTFAQGFGAGSSTYMGTNVTLGTDIITLHRSDDGTQVGTGVVDGGTPGVFNAEAYGANPPGGSVAVPTGLALDFRINGLMASQNIGTAPSGETVFQFVSDNAVFNLSIVVAAGGAVAVTPATAGMANAATQQLAVTYDGGDVDETNANVTFGTSDALVATVDADGLVTAQTASTGSATLTATLVGGQTATMTVSTGLRLIFATEAAGSVSGAVLTTQPIVHADLGGLQTLYTETVTMTATGAGTLTGNTTVTAVGGIATFTDLVYTAAVDGETFTLTATDGGGTYTAATSAAPIASDVVAAALAATVQPAGSVSAIALTTQPVITATGAAGVTDTDFVGVVTVTETSAGALTNNTATAVAGVATFVGLTYTATADAEAFTLTAASGALTTVALSAVTSDVLATVLVWSTPPAGAFKTIAMLTQPVVTAQDAAGLTDVGFTETITLSLTAGAGGLTGGLTVAAVAGVATFTTAGYDASGTVDELFTLQADDDAGIGTNLAAITVVDMTGSVQPPPVLTPIPAAVEDTQENQTPLLQWATVAVADNGYLVDLGVAPACESVLNDVAVAQGTLQYQAPRLADGSYCWRVASVGAASTEVWAADSTFDVVPTFGEWGMIFMIASMLGVGVWYMRRRATVA